MSEKLYDNEFFICISKPKNKLFIPDYVPPQLNKRGDVRYNLRMKMLSASGAAFPSSIDALASKNKKNINTPAKIASKITSQKINELKRHVQLTVLGER